MDDRKSLYFFSSFIKWPPAAILDARNSRSIEFLVISDQYVTFYFKLFSKWSPVAIFVARFSPKSMGTIFPGRSMATSHMKLVGAFQMKLWRAQVFSQHGRHRPFWSPICAKIDRVLPLRVVDTCVK